MDFNNYGAPTALGWLHPLGVGDGEVVDEAVAFFGGHALDEVFKFLVFGVVLVIVGEKLAWANFQHLANFQNHTARNIKAHALKFTDIACALVDQHAQLTGGNVSAISKKQHALD